VALRLSERRQVDTFAHLLDELEHDHRSDLADGAGTRAATPADAVPTGPGSTLETELERLLATATALRDVGGTGNGFAPSLAEPRRAEIRARLVTAIGTTGGIPAPRRAPGLIGGRRSAHGAPRRRRPGRPLLIAGAGLGVVIIGTGGITLASAGAMPGSLLYQVKRTVEQAQLDLSASPTNRGIRYLELAETRLSEVQYLLRQPDARTPGSSAERELTITMGDLSTDVTQGGSLLIGQVSHSHDMRAAGALVAFLNHEQQPIAALTGELPAALANEPRAITDTMHALTEQLANLATQLGGKVVYVPGGRTTPAGSSTTHATTPSTTPTGTTTHAGTTTGTSAPTTSPTTPPVGLSISSNGVEIVIPGLPTISLGFGPTATSTTTATTASTNDPNPN
jgi:hypothetical protein